MTKRMVSDQDLFDRVATHLLRQGKRSMSSNGIECAYRGQNGLSCAVGCLIPDDAYHQGLEGLTATAKSIQDGLPFSVNVDLLQRLQDVHDTTEPPVWRNRLRDLAQDYDLKVTVLC